jgi:hypothetical protein
MMYWALSVMMFAGLAAGLGDVTRDRIEDRDPIKQQDRLHDGSCKTASVISASPIYFNG